MATPTKYFTPWAIETLRDFIQEAEGHEVFLVGTTNNQKVVEEVRVFARGNEFAVPALLQVASYGEVVIHNHPSGVLEPSNADVGVASQLGNLGIGFYIVDNEVSKVYVVVEAFERKEKALLDPEKIKKIIAPGGPIAKKLPGYEYRPQQLEMIALTCQAFNEDKIAVIEAGTGVGKTMAYLLPAIYWAVNNKERCAVSTNTINLQEQLIKKDLPFLQSVLDVKFKAVLVKGRGNYVCLRKVEELESDFDFFAEQDEREELKALIGWAKNSRDGSKADLNYIPRETVWEKIASESDTCLRTKCQHYRHCFVNKARREAARADILVVNHHLLFADLSVHNAGIEVAVLPPYQRLILDEAHHIEEVATNYFGAGITRVGISRILGRLHRRKRDTVKGLFHYLEAKLYGLAQEAPRDLVARAHDLIDRTLLPAVESLESLNQEVMEILFQAVKGRAEEEQGEIKLRLTEAVREEKFWKEVVVDAAKNLMTELRVFANKVAALDKILKSIDVQSGDPLLSLRIEIMAQAARLDEAANTIEHVILGDDEEHIRWIEVQERSKVNLVRLRSSPLEVAETMKNSVYSQFKTVLLTSATLAVEGLPGQDKFSYLENRIGLNLVDKERCLELILPAPFDYQRQAIILIPMDVPEPNHPNFSQTLEKLIFKALTISEGKAFILFTSYGLLNLIHSHLEQPLKMLGINSLKQGVENRHRLIERFKRDKTSVLFGTDSFWEGVDVQGEALESVIITKLPFKVPTEPVIEARVEAIEKRGGNAFMEYTVPQATIKFKQGFGRLIRSKTDRGSVLIFDKRVVGKNYGAVFLKSLPPCHIVTGPQEKVFEELKKFFSVKPVQA